MSFDYSDLDLTAKELIADFGRSAILRTKVNSGLAYNPTITPTNTGITVVATKYSSFDVDGSLILATDKKFLMSSLVEPEKADIIVDGGVEYNIENVEVVAPGDTTILYKVQARA